MSWGHQDKVPPMGGLKQHKCVLSEFRRAEAGLDPCGGPEGECSISPSFCGSPAVPDAPWLVAPSPDLCLHLPMASPPVSYKVLSWDLGPTYLNAICKDLYSTEGHTLRFWVDVNFCGGDTIRPTTAGEGNENSVRGWMGAPGVS